MKNDIIYVLHEYGSPNHYISLVELGKQKGFKVKFRIFNPKSILRNLLRKNFGLAISSIGFLVSLPFVRKRKIVLGIAPFNRLLYPLSIILKKHIVYYHTSYTIWDGSIMAHPTKSDSLIRFWRNFIKNNIKHIFAVSQKTATELEKNNFINKEKISIVNHSYFPVIISFPKTKDNTFIFVGRLTETKGIPELLKIFSQRPNTELTIIGYGELEPLVKEYANKYTNIVYKGYFNSLEQIIPFYQQNSFCLMNSQRTGTWEELFGIAIIEGMASGCVPITTNHSGPMEIILSGINGFIVKEGAIESMIDNAIMMDDIMYQKLRNNAIKSGQNYHCSRMASKWIEIL